MRNKFAVFALILAVLLLVPVINAQQEQVTYVDAVFIYGDGCPHCAAMEPFLEEMEDKYSTFSFTALEVYGSEENRQTWSKLALAYGSSPEGVPTLYVGDKVIVGFGAGSESEIENEITECLSGYCEDPLDKIEDSGDVEELTFVKLVSLAAVDAINPCAMAVLLFILIAILTANPDKKKRVLYSGLMFALAIFLMYFVYGLIIVKFFQLVQAMAPVRLIIYKVLGAIAIILGIINIMDFIKYKPGRVGSEMPMMLRPKVKKIISKVTGPSGAFVTGLFVTLFLLPCTIGPYFIAGGILSAQEFIATLPPLALYNFIFVLPMIIITAIVYFGFAKVYDVSSWKDMNIKKVHLVTGIIMILLGLAMIFGLV